MKDLDAATEPLASAGFEMRRTAAAAALVTDPNGNSVVLALV